MIQIDHGCSTVVLFITSEELAEADERAGLPKQCSMEAPPTALEPQPRPSSTPFLHKS